MNLRNPFLSCPLGSLIFKKQNMGSKKLIEKVFLEATKGLRKEWFTTDQPYWYSYIVNLNLPLQVTYLTVLLESQVYNGGFHHYFCNGYGQFALETIDALIELNAYKKSGLLNRALSIVKYENISDGDFRNKLINKTLTKLFEGEDLFEPLGKLDDQYYRTADEDIMILLERFLRKEYPEYEV